MFNNIKNEGQEFMCGDTDVIGSHKNIKFHIIHRKNDQKSITMITRGLFYACEKRVGNESIVKSLGDFDNSSSTDVYY